LEIIKKYEQPQQNGEVDQIDGEEHNHLGNFLKFFANSIFE